METASKEDVEAVLDSWDFLRAATTGLNLGTPEENIALVLLLQLWRKDSAPDEGLENQLSSSSSSVVEEESDREDRLPAPTEEGAAAGGVGFAASEVGKREERSVRKNAFVLSPFIFKGPLIFILLMNAELDLEGCFAAVPSAGLLSFRTLSKVTGRKGLRPASIMAGSVSMMLGFRGLDEEDIERATVGIPQLIKTGTIWGNGPTIRAS